MRKKLLYVVLLVFGVCLIAGCPDNRGKAIKPDKFEPIPKEGPIGDGAGGGGDAAPPIDAPGADK